MLSDDAAEAAKDALGPRVMADGGSTRKWDTFESRVVYEMQGTMVEHPDPKTIERRAAEASLHSAATLEYDEMLKANIINLDSWLMPTWAERMPREIELDNDRTFAPKWREGVEVSLDVFKGEVIEAAEQRAGEDATHPAYVLGSWAYLAAEADHLKSGQRTIEKAFEEVCERPDAPDDATTDEFGGGRDE